MFLDPRLDVCRTLCLGCWIVAQFAESGQGANNDLLVVQEQFFGRLLVTDWCSQHCQEQHHSYAWDGTRTVLQNGDHLACFGLSTITYDGREHRGVPSLRAE